MRIPNHVQVLVIGAGPTGLALACDLARRGIGVRIVDKNAAPSRHSKAFGVQSGTLECLRENFGHALTDEFLASGHLVKGVSLHIDKHSPIWVDVGFLPTDFNHILILAQSETERLLEKQLSTYGVRVERSTELVSLRQDDGKVFSQLKGADGSTLEIVSDFAAGCDGAHSTVRHQLEIPFKGAQYSGDFLLGDVRVDWNYEYGMIHLFANERGAMACFPMKGEKKYRLVVIFPATQPDAPADVALSEFTAAANRVCPEIKISNPEWLTRFRVHHRMTETFQKDRIFLAGDAAHIHSPAGGQGMNIGIQDGLSLAYKLTRVLKDEADLKSLASYDVERIPIARSVLRGTHLVFQIALMEENFMKRFGRRFIAPRLASTKTIQRFIIGAISEIKMARKEIERRRQP